MRMFLRAVELAVLGPLAVPVWIMRGAHKKSNSDLEQI